MTVLAALAVLAERAADRSFPVRCFVLFVLRIAETVVEDFIFDATGLPPFTGEIETAGSTPENALLLAARLRMLAAALAVLLPPAWRYDDWPALRGSASGPAAPAFDCRSGGWTPIPWDTS